MNTDRVKKTLFKTMQHPTKKQMAELAEQVISLCDHCDNRESLSGIINAGNESLEHSFKMLERLMQR